MTGRPKRAAKDKANAALSEGTTAKTNRAAKKKANASIDGIPVGEPSKPLRKKTTAKASSKAMVKSAATFKQNKKEIAIKPSASSEGKRKRDENIFVETDNGHDEPMDNEDVDFEQTAATSGKRKKANDVELMPPPQMPVKRAPGKIKKVDKSEIVDKASATKKVAKKSKTVVVAKVKKPKGDAAGSRGKKKATQVKAKHLAAVPKTIDEEDTSDIEDIEMDPDENLHNISDREFEVNEAKANEEVDSDLEENTLDEVNVSPHTPMANDDESDNFNEELQALNRSQNDTKNTTQINIVDSSSEILANSRNSNSSSVGSATNVTEAIAETSTETITTARNDVDINNSSLDLTEGIIEAIAETSIESILVTTTTEARRISSSMFGSMDADYSMRSSVDMFDISSGSVVNNIQMETSSNQSFGSTAADASLSPQPLHQNQADEPDSINMSMQPPFRPPNIFVKQVAALKKKSENFDESIIFVPNSAPEIINISDVTDSDSTLNESDTPNYSFSILKTDDSTDDEDCTNENSRKKRRDPPAWSSRENRVQLIEEQSHIPSKAIDTFFMTPPVVDLIEIFPNINPNKTKRRPSSCHWTTPPRYSLMPKH